MPGMATLLLAIGAPKMVVGGLKSLTSAREIYLGGRPCRWRLIGIKKCRERRRRQLKLAKKMALPAASVAALVLGPGLGR